jgi:hypothetical protein
LSLSHVVETAERVNAGLDVLASARRLRVSRLNPKWYGIDPIHIRPSFWRTAWQEILGVGSGEQIDRGSRWEGLRLYLKPAERQWMCGVERFTPQSGAALPAGARVSLF